MVAIGVFMVPVFARVSRGAAIQIWARDYIKAARMAGKGDALITLEHVLPNISAQIIVQLAIQTGLGILSEAGLSFLGMGVSPPTPSWGRMLAESQTYLASAPHLVLAPGLAIALAVLGLNLLGDGLRDLTDPRRGARLMMLEIKDLRVSFQREKLPPAEVIHGVSVSWTRRDAGGDRWRIRFGGEIGALAGNNGAFAANRPRDGANPVRGGARYSHPTGGGDVPPAR